MNDEKLTGQACACRGCGEIFKSEAAFDKHRTGQGHDRRCMTANEMMQCGMVKNQKGKWITKASRWVVDCAQPGPDWTRSA